MILKYSLAWIPMVFLAIVNGAVRELTYGRAMPEARAQQVSVVTGIFLFGVYAWLLSLKWPLQSSEQATLIGFLWLALTVAFEFIFGHYVMHHPWSALLHEYNILAGRLWILVLLAVTFLPLVVFKIG
jgi:hypothetical protein